jgi:hypothetical protein
MRSYLNPVIEELDRLDNRLININSLPIQEVLVARTRILNVSNLLLKIIQGNLDNQLWAPIKAQAGAFWNAWNLANMAGNLHLGLQASYQAILETGLDFIYKNDEFKFWLVHVLGFPEQIDKETTYIMPHYVPVSYGLAWGDISPADDIRLFSTMVTELDALNTKGAVRDFANWIERVSLYGTLVVNGKTIDTVKIRTIAEQYANGMIDL